MRLTGCDLNHSVLVVGLLFICVFLFVNMCQGRIAVAAAVSFSVETFVSVNCVGDGFWGR